MLTNKILNKSITVKRILHKNVPIRVINRRNKIPKATVMEVINTVATDPLVHYIGKSVLVFTMIYCGLNYLMYREVNRKIDDSDDKNI